METKLLKWLLKGYVYKNPIPQWRKGCVYNGISEKADKARAVEYKEYSQAKCRWVRDLLKGTDANY